MHRLKKVFLIVLDGGMRTKSHKIPNLAAEGLLNEEGERQMTRASRRAGT